MNRNYITVNDWLGLSDFVQEADGSFKSLFDIFKDLRKSWAECYGFKVNAEEDLDARSEELDKFLSGFVIKEAN